MNRLFAELVEQNTPKFNPDIVNGLACIYVPYAMQWLDEIFRSAAKSFPKGLIYEGCEKCTPEEEYYETTKSRNNKRLFDLAESDIFLIKLRFSFEEEEGKRELLPERYMYLPFVREAGIFRISGTTYHVTGVLSDKVISPGHNSIFVRLIRDRLKFRHIGHTVMVNNNRETFNIVWSNIYRKLSKERSAPVTTRCFHSVAHYLFAKYGFVNTFQRYCGFVPTIGNYNSDHVDKPNTVLCRSSYYGTNSKPSSYVGFNYQPSQLYLEIPADKWNRSTAAFVAGFFYVIDHFPERLTLDRIHEEFLWSVLLGHVIFSGAYSEANLWDRITEHFTTLDDYLDVIIQDKLKEIGWHVENFYDLIAKIMIDFPNILLGGQIDSNSMFNKNIEILYYMLSELAFKMFKVIYRLRKSKSRKALTFNTVKEAFNKIMTPRAIFRISKETMIIESVSYCGDHKFPKLTSKITEQESGSSRYKRKSSRVTLTENNHLHCSMLEAGNVLFLSKSNPMPNTRLNPFVNFDLKTATLIPNPRFAEKLAKLQVMLNNVRDDSEEFAVFDVDSEETLELAKDDVSLDDDDLEIEDASGSGGDSDSEDD